MELAFWLPLVLIFASAMLAAIIKRYSKDPCLKAFHKSYVFVRLQNGRWISGDFFVYSNCLEVRYREPHFLGSKYQKLSYVLYEHNLENVDRVLRPSPREGTEERKAWEHEIARLRNPSPFRVARRRMRNLFNMLRDAFTQSITVLFGVMKKRSRFAAVAVDESKVGEMGKSLASAIPNAYEPILERYLGHQIVVETLRGEKLIEQSGVLQEYSAKYVLVRDVDLLEEKPPDIPANLFDERFDVAFPRTSNLVRHLARIVP
jgi:hypothetical protein